MEQGVNPDRGIVTGLEKIRLHPPGYRDDPLAVFMPPADIQAIFDHRRNLQERYPKAAANTISELPDDVQFRHAIPAVIREIV